MDIRTFTTAAEIVAHAFDNTAVRRRDERIDMPSVVLAAVRRRDCPLDVFRGPDGVYLWEQAAQVMLDMGLNTTAAINAHCDALEKVRRKEWAARAEADDLAQAEYDYHVKGCDAAGVELMDTGLVSDMGMYASMSTLEAAHEWAASAFARDARVAQVQVSIYRRTPRSVGWVFHKGLTTIHRPA